MKPLIFVAGPYTEPDPVINVRRACVVADKLVALGAAAAVPHLTMLWHLTSPAPVEEWYRRDLDVLDHCHALVRFYGPSTSADREWEYARSRGLERWALGMGRDYVMGVTLPAWIRGWVPR